MSKDLVPAPPAQELLPVEAQADADFLALDRRRALRIIAGSLLLPLLGTPSWLAADPRLRALRRHASHLPCSTTSTSGDLINSAKAIIAVTAFTLALAAPLNPVLGIVGGLISLVGALIGIFWPQSSGPSAEDIWNLIKDKVKTLVDNAISDAEFAVLQSAITGLHDNLSDYAALVQQHQQLRSAQSLADLRAKYVAVDAFCIGIRPQFLPQGSEMRFLPLFVQFANLHHILLQDMVFNGKAYGVEPGIVAGDVEKLCQTVAVNGKTFDYFWVGVQHKYGHTFGLGDSNHRIPITKITAPSGNKGYIEDGLYDRVRQNNVVLAQLTHLAKDFRDLWPYIGGMQKGPGALTRELWFGPFGHPDCFEFSGDFTAINDGYDKSSGTVDPGTFLSLANNRHTAGYAACVSPTPSPLEPLRHINVAQTNFSRGGYPWQFPSGFDLYRDGDGLPVETDRFGISLASQFGGPVVGIRVDAGRYISRDIAGTKASIPAAGDLVSMIYFTQKDGTVHAVGSDPGNQIGVVKEMKYYFGENIAVPEGHILSGMHTCSTVTRLYNQIGQSVTSIGSIMFGFRLEDPNLTPPPDLLTGLAATNPTPLSAENLVAISANATEAAGKPLSDEAHADLKARFEHELASPLFKTRRADFQQRIADGYAKRNRR